MKDEIINGVRQIVMIKSIESKSKDNMPFGRRGGLLKDFRKMH